jgi:hypothetical protein
MEEIEKRIAKIEETRPVAPGATREEPVAAVRVFLGFLTCERKGLLDEARSRDTYGPW